MIGYVPGFALVLRKLEAMPTKSDIEGKSDQAHEEHGSDPSVPETGIIDGGIENPKPCVGHIDEQGPPTESKKPISDCEMGEG